MKSNIIKNSTENTKNKFLGGYINSLNNYPERSYISIGVKDDNETIYIMIFKKCGYGKNKYTNPTVKIVMDAFDKGIPIAFVYTESEQSNVMLCAYTNFSSTCSSNETTEKFKEDFCNNNQEEYEQLELPL